MCQTKLCRNQWSTGRGERRKRLRRGRNCVRSEGGERRPRPLRQSRTALVSDAACAQYIRPYHTHAVPRDPPSPFTSGTHAHRRVIALPHLWRVVRVAQLGGHVEAEAGPPLHYLVTQLDALHAGL